MGTQRRTRKVMRILFLSAIMGCSLSLFGTAFAANSQDTEQQAYNAYLDKNYGKAIELYQSLLAQDNVNVSYTYNLGVAYQQLGDYPKALQAYQRTLDLDPDYYEAYNNMGAIYLQQKQWKSAIDTFKHILKHRQEDANSWFNLGLSYEQSNQKTEAAKAYRQAFLLDPKLTQAKSRFDRLQSELKLPELNMQYVNKRPGMQKNYQEARALAEKRQWKEAGQRLEKIVEQYPDFLDAQFLLGRSYQQTGQDAKALQSFVKVVAAQPEHVGAHHQMALTYERQGLPLKSTEILINLLQIKPSYLPAHYDLGRIYEEMQVSDQALERFLKLYQLEPSYADVAYRLGRLYHLKNNTPEAVKYYQQSVKQKPAFAPAYYQLAKLAIDSQHFDSAERLLRKSLTLSNNNPEIHYLLATVYYHQKKPTATIFPELNQAITLNPVYTDALSMRGIIYYGEQKFSPAIKDFEAALKTEPGRADIYRNLGVSYIKSGEGGKALLALQNYLKYQPEAADRDKIEKLIQDLKGIKAAR